MDKKIKYLDKLFWELCYDQLIVLFMMYHEDKTDKGVKRDLDNFIASIWLRLQDMGRNSDEIKKGLVYIEEIAIEKSTV